MGPRVAEWFKLAAVHKCFIDRPMLARFPLEVGFFFFVSHSSFPPNWHWLTINTQMPRSRLLAELKRLRMPQLPRRFLFSLNWRNRCRNDIESGELD